MSRPATRTATVGPLIALPPTAPATTCALGAGLFGCGLFVECVDVVEAVGVDDVDVDADVDPIDVDVSVLDVMFVRSRGISGTVQRA
jgi:hypothetical protein